MKVLINCGEWYTSFRLTNLLSDTYSHWFKRNLRTTLNQNTVNAHPF